MFSKSISVLLLTFVMLFSFSCKESNPDNSKKNNEQNTENPAEVDVKENLSYSVSLGVMPSTKYEGEGMLIGQVNKGKVAEKSGLLKGDVILEMDGDKISDLRSYTKALVNYSKGDTAKVKIKRGEDLMNYQVVFE